MLKNAGLPDHSNLLVPVTEKFRREFNVSVKERNRGVAISVGKIQEQKGREIQRPMSEEELLRIEGENLGSISSWAWYYVAFFFISP